MMFLFEYTDIFCGELNYSFLGKFCVKAKTEKGAARILARYLSISYRYDKALELYTSKTKLSAFYAMPEAFNSEGEYKLIN